MENRVIVCPFDHKENDYIQLLTQVIYRAGYIPVPQHGNQRRSRFFLYNWYENIDSPNATIVLARKIFKIFVLKVVKKRIIWVMHNKIQHNKSNVGNRIMRWYMAHMSNAIMILCDESMKSVITLGNEKRMRLKTYKVPLINYCSLIGDIPEAQPISGKIRMLSFGRIQPYKCLDVLIEALNNATTINKVELSIVGNAQDSKYLDFLREMAKDNSNVKFISRFVSMDELKVFARDTDLFVVPLDVTSSLNSSAVMMAFSLAKPVICPNIGTTLEYQDISSFSYTYNYDGRMDHISSLKECIEKADQDFSLKQDIFIKMGKKARETVQRINSISAVSEEFKELMEGIK